MRPPVLEPNRAYTFADYFKLPFAVDEVLAAFGFGFEARPCQLPLTQQEVPGLAALKARLEAGLPYMSLTSETARRELLIAPVLYEVMLVTKVRLRIEYPIQVSEQLQGSLDYFMQRDNCLLVVEAKNADLTRGFTQLAVELVALDRWVESSAPLLYGAVSIGDYWQFGILDRTAKRVTQDLNPYPVPRDVESLVRILTGILLEQ